MKKVIYSVFLMTGVALAQSGISNPPYKPHARFIIPVQQQPEFTGVQTNVLSFTTWETNGTAHAHSSTNLVAAVNTNSFPYADFIMYGIAQDTGTTNAAFSSMDTAFSEPGDIALIHGSGDVYINPVEADIIFEIPRNRYPAGPGDALYRRSHGDIR